MKTHSGTIFSPSICLPLQAYNTIFCTVNHYKPATFNKSFLFSFHFTSAQSRWTQTLTHYHLLSSENPQQPRQVSEQLYFQPRAILDSVHKCLTHPKLSQASNFSHAEENFPVNAYESITNPRPNLQILFFFFHRYWRKICGMNLNMIQFVKVKGTLIGSWAHNKLAKIFNKQVRLYVFSLRDDQG